MATWDSVSLTKDRMKVVVSSTNKKSSMVVGVRSLTVGGGGESSIRVIG